MSEASDFIQNKANELMSTMDSASQTLTDFIDLLTAKIQALEDFLDRIQKLLDALKNLKILLPNLYILKVGPIGGSAALAKEIRDATNRPLSSPADFAFGIAIVVGGPPTLITLPILHAIL